MPRHNLVSLEKKSHSAFEIKDSNDFKTVAQCCFKINVTTATLGAIQEVLTPVILHQVVCMYVCVFSYKCRGKEKTAGSRDKPVSHSDHIRSVGTHWSTASLMGYAREGCEAGQMTYKPQAGEGGKKEGSKE